MGRKPDYLRVRELVAAEIRSNMHVVRLPTEFEMCSRYGIGRSTLRKALSLLTEEGILEARPGLGTFIRSENIETECLYPSERRKVVGYVFDNGLHRRFEMASLRKMVSVAQSLSAYNCLLDIFAFNNSKNAVAELLQAGIDGLIWASPLQEKLPIIREIQRTGIPIVLTETYPYKDLNVVTTDSFEVGRMAVEYMFRKGYRRLATIIRSLDHDVYREKIAGVKRGMEDKGLAIDEYSFMVLAEAQKKLKAMSKARNDIDCFIYLAGGASTFRRMEAELFPKSLKGKPFITVSTSSKGKAPILLEQIEATGKKAGEMLLKLFDNTAQQPFTIKFPPILISK